MQNFGGLSAENTRGYISMDAAFLLSASVHNPKWRIGFRGDNDGENP
jgi:hypothetical protein